MQWLKWLPALCAGAALYGAPASDATLVRMPLMAKVPVIDGKVTNEEWKYASTTFGGVSPESGLLTFRKNDFRLGSDGKFLYFAVTSETPVQPQVMTADDRVEIRVISPNGKKAEISFDSTGKGNIPDGVKVVNGFEISLMNLERGKCWSAEVAIPVALFGLDSVADNSEWKVQMARRWSSVKEVGFWHPVKKADSQEMGTVIFDSTAPAVSFDGFGTGDYTATGNYQWSYRMENSSKRTMHLHSGCYMVGIQGAATLDINNPDLIGDAQKNPINPEGKVVKPGETGILHLYLMAQFPGKPRLLYSLVSDKQNGKVYYQRTMFWDTSISNRKACWKEDQGLPFLNCGFYPSYGNRLRCAVTFNWKMPVILARIEAKDSSGKVIWKNSKADFGRKLTDYEVETTLPGLPLGDYTVTLTTTEENGTKHQHVRTFSIRKFPWQNLDIGKERIIIPPFKPLVLDKKTGTVKALLTGYKLGGELWNEVYADGENILAAPVQFFLDGKPFVAETPKLVSAEDDRIVYETTAKQGNVTLKITQDYDYDGFCKVTLNIIPQGKVSLKNFELRIPLKNSIVKYIAGVGNTRSRAQGKADCTLAANEGEVKTPGIRMRAGEMIGYIWLGGKYKGFSWMMDGQKGRSLDPKVIPQKLVRNGNTITWHQSFVNQPTTWEKPLTFVMGFEPTPVKPAAKEFRRITGWMYSYPPAEGGHFADLSCSQWILGYNYPINTIPNGDNSYYEAVIASRGKHPTREWLKKFELDYMARNGEWIKKNAPLTNIPAMQERLSWKRYYGMDHFGMYHNPTFYSSRWPEAEMYKAEWQPWNYPADDAENEYIAVKTHEYIDKMLYEMRAQARMGFEGMNFDCFPLGGGFNVVTSNAFREKPGYIHMLTNINMLQILPPGLVYGNNLFGWRELCKRTAHMLYTEKRLVYGVPWVELHATDGQAVPVTAFCSTALCTECGSGGATYQERYPEGYVLADLSGTQTGVVPRVIVSTHSPKLPKLEQVDTLIAWSFAFGMMNHVDQGVTGGHPDYQRVRDISFSFGYGRPENRTILVFDREEQPVKFDAASVRSSQVIRPDGKALLMIGNLGKAVKTKFDVSGLGYGNVKLTNALTGKVLVNPEISLKDFGYALIKVEKQ